MRSAESVERGAAIRRRRIALGLMNHNQFAKATRDTRDQDGNKLDRQTLTKAEAGDATSSKLDEIEAWLSRQEAENGMDDGAAAAHGLLKVTMRNVYGIGELVFEGRDSDELADAVGKIMDRLGLRDPE